MAKLNLLPNKEFEIVFNGQVINGKFGTWAVVRLCQKQNISFEKLNDLMSVETLTKENAGVGFDINAEMILCAVEYSCRLAKKPVDYDLVHVYEWIDELGGFNSEQIQSLLSYAAGEKKSEEKEEQPPLKKSNVHITLPGEQKTSSGDQTLKKSA